MADIALCVGDTGHSSTTIARNALISLGHTVNTYNEATVTPPQLASVDLIVWLRDQAANNSTGVLNIISAFNAGIPLLMSASGKMSLVGLSSGGVVGAPHPLAFTIDNPLQVAQAVISAGGFTYDLRRDQLASGAKITHGFAVSNNSNWMTVAKCDARKGSKNISGNPFPANVSFCSSVYSMGSITTFGLTLISESIAFLTSEPHLVPVTIDGLPNNQTSITIFNSSKKLIGEYESNTQGQINDVYLPVGNYTAICFSNDVSKNSKVIDFTV